MKKTEKPKKADKPNKAASNLNMILTYHLDDKLNFMNKIKYLENPTPSAVRTIKAKLGKERAEGFFLKYYTLCWDMSCVIDINNEFSTNEDLRLWLNPFLEQTKKLRSMIEKLTPDYFVWLFSQEAVNANEIKIIYNFNETLKTIEKVCADIYKSKRYKYKATGAEIPQILAGEIRKLMLEYNLKPTITKNGAWYWLYEKALLAMDIMKGDLKNDLVAAHKKLNPSK